MAKAKMEEDCGGLKPIPLIKPRKEDAPKKAVKKPAAKKK